MEAVTLSSTEILVSWTPPPEIDQNGVITHYEVHYEPFTTFNGTFTSNSASTNGSGLQIVLVSLQENVKYSVTVRAYTSVGPGPFSSAVLNATIEDGKIYEKYERFL